MPTAKVLAARADQILNELWRELRNGAGPERMAYAAGTIDGLLDVGILDRTQMEGWIARIKRCPGHLDESGRGWCAYGCDMKVLRAAGEAS